MQVLISSNSVVRIQPMTSSSSEKPEIVSGLLSLDFQAASPLIIHRKESPKGEGVALSHNDVFGGLAATTFLVMIFG